MIRQFHILVVLLLLLLLTAYLNNAECPSDISAGRRKDRCETDADCVMDKRGTMCCEHCGPVECHRYCRGSGFNDDRQAWDSNTTVKLNTIDEQKADAKGPFGTSKLSLHALSMMCRLVGSNPDDPAMSWLAPSCAYLQKMKAPGCCQKSVRYCGWQVALQQSCGNNTFLPLENNIYICQTGRDPVLDRRCNEKCLDGGVDNDDVCEGDERNPKEEENYAALCPGSSSNKCHDLSEGLKCGCYKSTCWKYLVNRYGIGHPWCYTQDEGAPYGQQKWAKCFRNEDCSWFMTCGNNLTYEGWS